MEKYLEQLVDWCVAIAGRLVLAALILLAGKIAAKLLVRFFPKGSKRHPFDPTVRQFLLHFSKVVLYAIVAVCVVGTLGVEMSSVITVLASAGVAVSLALQGSLANFASGLMILIFKPYKMGDCIESGDKKGTVIDVGIFYTVIRAADDDSEIHIPNSAMTSNTVTNFLPGTENRRIDLDFTVAYGTDLEKVKTVILGVIRADSRILKTPAPFVRMTALQDSAMSFKVRVWASAENMLPVKIDLTERVTNALNENHIEIPFPQMDVHLHH